MPELSRGTPDAAPPAPGAVSRILDLLAEEGYRPKVLEGDEPVRCIEFKADGYRFMVRVNEADPDFVALCMGFLFEEPAPELDLALRVAMEVQTEAKVAKVFVDPRGKFYELQAELFLGGQALNAEHLRRCIGAIRRAASQFYDRLCTEAPAARA